MFSAGTRKRTRFPPVEITYYFYHELLHIMPRIPFFMHFLCVGITFLMGCNKEEITISNLDTFYVYVGTSENTYGEIYVSSSDAGFTQRISNIDELNLSDSEYKPTISKDGRFIAFVSFNSDIQIYDRTAQQIIASFKEMTYRKRFTFIPNNKIAYIGSAMPTNIFIINYDGTGETPITNFMDYPLPGMSDTSLIYLNGEIAWYEIKEKILASVYWSVTNKYYFILVDPDDGKITEMIPIPQNASDNLFIRNNTAIWAYSDSIYIFNLVSKTYHSLHCQGCLNPTLSPDENRIAYLMDELDQLTPPNPYPRYMTNLYTCNVNGYDKRNLTADIPDNKKAKSRFHPFWLDNNHLLYSANHIYSIEDKLTPQLNIVLENKGAYGEVLYHEP